MKIIGHRGARGLAPENSLKAIQRALTYDVDMIEVDVRVQGDELVLSHDPLSEEGTYASLEDALTLVDGKVPINLENSI